MVYKTEAYKSIKFFILFSFWNIPSKKKIKIAFLTTIGVNKITKFTPLWCSKYTYG